MTQLFIDNYKIDVIKKNIKNLHLSVHPPSGRIRIASPSRLSDETIRLFAISKLPWIKKHIKRFNNQDRQTEREYISGESHYVFGTRYLLNVIPTNSKSQVTIRNRKFIDLYVKEGSTKAQRAKLLNEWYRHQLKDQMPALIDKWEKEIGVGVNEWGIKKMKTRWGSCNIKSKRIWINLELAKKPIECLEYIIVHEMIHLLVRKHNEKFKAYMNKFVPQWSQYKEELNRFPLSHSEWEY